MCTRSPEEWLPNAYITATCYRGNDRASGQVDTQTITGPLNRQIAVTDAKGKEFIVRIVEIFGQSVLLEYRSCSK